MKKVIISGVFTIAAAVISANISWQLGKTNGVNELTNYMSEALVPVYGDNDIVTINDLGTADYNF